MTTESIIHGLQQLVTNPDAHGLSVARDGNRATSERVMALFDAFDDGLTVLVFDHFDDQISAKGELKDPDFQMLLEACLNYSEDYLKIIALSRETVSSLRMTQPARHVDIRLNEGLPPEYTERLLRSMDFDGSANLRDADTSLLLQAHELTHGHPKALEILFANLRANLDLTIYDIVDEASGEALPEIMETIFGRAYDSVTENQKCAMQALAVFGRPVTREAVQALWEPETETFNARESLARLVNLHLVHRVQHERKYYLHPDEAAFVLQEMSQSAREKLTTRAAAWFGKSKPEAKAVQRYADLDAWFAEVDMLSQLGDKDASGLAVFDLANLLLKFGSYGEMVSRLEATIESVQDAELREKCKRLLGLAHYMQGEYTAAKSSFLEAHAESDRREDREGKARALNRLGMVSFDLSDLDAAIEYDKEAIELYEGLGDSTSAAIVSGNMGGCLAEMGLTHEAMRLTRVAIDEMRSIGDRFREGLFLGNLAERLTELGDLEAARSFYEQGLQIGREDDLRFNQCIQLCHLGRVHIHDANYATARAALTESLEIADSIGNRQFQNAARTGLAVCSLVEGFKKEAQSWIRDALRFQRPLGDSEFMTRTQVAFCSRTQFGSQVAT